MGTRTNQNKSGFAPVYKGDLFYKIAGSGHPILFIHAGIADSSMWDDHFSFFSQFFQVIRMDVPGARKIVFPGAAHMLPMEQSQRFNDEVFSFLK
ncbi:MAG: hypothetical protein A2029_11775 [Chloroflexi bacterium RBG_19FT_COMBO_47_9]|nr:MAG: hypothetical protein A2029_11775 [Chloroflexi bacterium RBG_19FT_COMBO_47_9]